MCNEWCNECSEPCAKPILVSMTRWCWCAWKKMVYTPPHLAPNANTLLDGFVPVYQDGKWTKITLAQAISWWGSSIPANLSVTTLTTSGSASIWWNLSVAWTTTLQNLIVNGTSQFNGNVDFLTGTTVDFTGVTVTWLPSSSWPNTVISQWSNVTITWSGTVSDPYIINAAWGSSAVGSLTNVIWITQIKMANAGPMSWTTLVVTEALATWTYHVSVNANSVPVWFLQVTKWIGNFTITSTASESWLTFTYVIHKS